MINLSKIKNKCCQFCDTELVYFKPQNEPVKFSMLIKLVEMEKPQSIDVDALFCTNCFNIQFFMRQSEIIENGSKKARVR